MAASIISALAAVAAAVISAVSAVTVAKISRKNDALKHHTEIREKEAILQGRMVAALCDLSEVTSIAVKGGQTNGNMEAAQKAAQEAKKNYNQFLEETAIKEISA